MPEERSEAEVVAIIERIFTETLSIAPPAPEVDIIEAALLDSLGLVTLLFEIEQEVGLQMPLESLEVDDFRSVRLIAQLIVRMRGGERGGELEEAGGRAPSTASDGAVSADRQGAPTRSTGSADT